MEFDKNKMLTVVTADQAKVGQKGWFADELGILRERVEKESPNVLERVDLSEDARYIFETNKFRWSLFYPALEPTYRRFANAEEFAPYRDKWVLYNQATRRILSYNNYGVIIAQANWGDSGVRFITFETAFKEFRFEDGTPFGVKES